MLSRPKGRKPRARSRATAVESYGDLTGARIFEAQEQVSPSATMQSLMPTGMPSNSLFGFPSRRRRSEASASASTRSGSMWRNALISPSFRRMRRGSRSPVRRRRTPRRPARRPARGSACRRNRFPAFQFIPSPGSTCGTRIRSPFIRAGALASMRSRPNGSPATSSRHTLESGAAWAVGSTPVRSSSPSSAMYATMFSRSF